MNLFKYIMEKGRTHLSGAQDEKYHELTNNWTSTLGDVCERLNSTSQITEQEFLDIGNKLQDFYDRAREMSDMSSRVVDLMTGGEISNSTEGLHKILDELKKHLLTSEGHFTKISGVLNQYMTTMQKVSSQLDGFNLIILNLSMLGFFTRVENAHVFNNASGFTSLTDEVKNLSSSINEKIVTIRSKSHILVESIQNALSKVTDSEKAQNNQARIILNNTMSNHSKLIQMNNTAVISARNIAQRYQEITDSIGTIVSSLQFHDITRQQIEHVKEVLGKIITEIELQEHTIGRQASTVADACSLQIDQMRLSRREFSCAVDEVKENMNDLAAGVGDILDEAQKTAWMADADGMGFMEEIDSGIITVISCLDDNNKNQLDLTRTMASVCDMISEMASFIKEIESMGQNLQLIALNARIKAAHMGSEGVALDVISGGIYELSKNSRHDTTTLMDMLEGVVSTAKSFDVDIAEMQHIQEDQVRAIAEDLQNIINSLHNVNDDVLSIITTMTISGRTLVEDIHKTTGNICVHNRFQDILSKTQDDLQILVDEANILSPAKDNKDTISCLKDIDNIYTMKSERDVHIKHMDRKKNPEKMIDTDKDGLGDNVELF